MNEENLVDIVINIDDNLFLELAKQAHDLKITLNEHVINILEKYIGANGELPESQEISEQNKLCSVLSSATKDIVLRKITEKTLAGFGYAFSNWNSNYHGDLTVTEIIGKGFDAADNDEPITF